MAQNNKLFFNQLMPHGSFSCIFPAPTRMILRLLSNRVAPSPAVLMEFKVHWAHPFDNRNEHISMQSPLKLLRKPNIVQTLLSPPKSNMAPSNVPLGKGNSPYLISILGLQKLAFKQCSSPVPPVLAKDKRKNWWLAATKWDFERNTFESSQHQGLPAQAAGSWWNLPPTQMN